MGPQNQAVVSDAVTDHASRRRDALLVVGMHRSGTSYLGSLLLAAGVHLGDRLLGRSHGNVKGHFEDEDVLHFHERCLGAQGLGTEGYDTNDRIVLPERLQQEALRLVATRRERGTTWGWKEPRTTLFLDFWEGLLPEAKFVFVFRRPWEVVDSLFRRGDPSFRANPSHAIAVWTHYNRLLLDFYQRHPEKTFICEVTQAIESPATVFDNIRKKLGIALGRPSELFEAGLFHQDARSGHAHLLKVVSKEAHSLYLQLRELSGSESELPATDANPGGIDGIRQRLLQDWDLRHQLAEAHLEISRLQATRERTLSRRFARLQKTLMATLLRGRPVGSQPPPQHVATMSDAVLSGLMANSPKAFETLPRRRAA